MGKKKLDAEPQRSGIHSFADSSNQYLTPRLCKQYVLGELSNKDKKKVEELLRTDIVNQLLLQGVEGYIEHKGLLAFERLLNDRNPAEEFSTWLDDFTAKEAHKSKKKHK